MTRNINISVKLLEKDSVIIKKILTGLLKDANKAIKKAMPKIDKRIRAATRTFFENNDTYIAIAGGELEAHFGFRDGEIRAREIVNKIIENIEIDFYPITLAGTKFKGKITLGVLLKDFIDILFLPEASVDTQEGYKLLWLDWLLIRGNRIIVSEHEIKFDSSISSRSGKAIMIASEAGVWRVPPEHAGTVSNNWLTKAISDTVVYSSVIDTIIHEEIYKAI